MEEQSRELSAIGGLLQQTLLAFNTVFFNFSIERRAADAQQFGCLGNVIAGAFKSIDD